MMLSTILKLFSLSLSLISRAEATTESHNVTYERSPLTIPSDSSGFLNNVTYWFEYKKSWRTDLLFYQRSKSTLN